MRRCVGCGLRHPIRSRCCPIGSTEALRRHLTGRAGDGGPTQPAPSGPPLAGRHSVPSRPRSAHEVDAPRSRGSHPSRPLFGQAWRYVGSPTTVVRVGVGCSETVQRPMADALREANARTPVPYTRAESCLAKHLHARRHMRIVCLWLKHFALMALSSALMLLWPNRHHLKYLDSPPPGRCLE